MKTAKLILASLTLGLMVASCQSGLEEVLEPSAVQDKQASTRADEDTPIGEVVIDRQATESGIAGPSIIGGTTSFAYTVSPPAGTTTVWSYSPLITLNTLYSDNSVLVVSLNYPNSPADEYIYARYYNADGSLNSIETKLVGINGPHKDWSSVRVERASDGVEAYPSTAVGMEPNTWYYAYLTVPYSVTISEWIFSNASDITYNNNKTQCHFKTDSQGWTSVQVKAKMSPYNVTKVILDKILYD